LARPTLTIASGNPVKVAEIEAMLGPLPLEIRRQPSDLEVEETGESYLENARLKAMAAARRTGHWALADDSGLEVDALDGAPGLFSARFAPSNADKVNRLLDALKGIPYRSARFRSAMVLCSPQGECLDEAEGVCWGELLPAPAYPGGGLESLFWVREAQCSYGEMNDTQLARLGSRGKAARSLAPHLRQRLGLS
jgi:XTP/dITP diphosphohydrolase